MSKINPILEKILTSHGIPVKTAADLVGEESATENGTVPDKELQVEPEGHKADVPADSEEIADNQETGGIFIGEGTASSGKEDGGTYELNKGGISETKKTITDPGYADGEKATPELQVDKEAAFISKLEKFASMSNAFAQDIAKFLKMAEAAPVPADIEELIAAMEGGAPGASEEEPPLSGKEQAIMELLLAQGGGEGGLGGGEEPLINGEAIAGGEGLGGEELGPEEVALIDALQSLSPEQVAELEQIAGGDASVPATEEPPLSPEEEAVIEQLIGQQAAAAEEPVLDAEKQATFVESFKKAFTEYPQAVAEASKFLQEACKKEAKLKAKNAEQQERAESYGKVLDSLIHRNNV